MKKKIVYIISKLEKSLEYEWLATFLDDSKYELSFILLNDHKTEFEKFLDKNLLKYSRIEYSGKKDFFRALRLTRKELSRIKPDVINCNLLDANIIGLTAGKLAGVKQRVYTRHHSDFNFKYSPKGVYYDKWANFLATDIIAISENVKDILTNKERVNEKKIKVIPYGFAFEEFDTISDKRISSIKNKYHLSNSYPIIGVVSRYVKWKGIPFILTAFSKLLTDYPDAKLVLANAGDGDDAENVKEILSSLPKDSFIEIEFENDNIALFKSLDMFVHVPVDLFVEAYGRIYIEALAAKVPSIFTVSGIARDFVDDKKNALVVDYKNSEMIYLAMKEVLKNNNHEMIENAYNLVKSKFSIEQHINQLETFYDG